MDQPLPRLNAAPSGSAVVLALAALTFLVHAATNGAYGYFRDELYYIACSDHLAAGYVDHPPLSILVLALNRALAGDSLFAMRFLPALAGACLVLVTGLLARQLGGGRFAQAVAATAVLVAPVYLEMGNFFSMNAFEPLTWTLCGALVIRIIQTGNARLWLLFGVVAGLGLENKHSMVFFGFGLFVALLLTPQRRLLRDRWLWGGVALAALIFLPNVVWQATHGWPTLEFMRHAQQFKNTAISPVEFLLQQVLMVQPVALPIWLAGLGYYLFSTEGRRYRVIGWTYLIVLTVFLFEHAKSYYLAPIYPLLLAGGAVAIDRGIQRRRHHWLRPALLSLLVVGGVVTAPLALPVLPVEAFVRYGNALGVGELAKRAPSERNAVAELPQYFADMFGWQELVAAIAAAYNSLPPEDRAQAAIFVQNYGEAGAIDFFGKAYHLPPAISPHNTYWLWGPGRSSGEIVIVLGGSEQELQTYFESVVQVGATHCRYCMPFENNRPIYIARKIKQPLSVIWPQLKRYI